MNSQDKPGPAPPPPSAPTQPAKRQTPPDAAALERRRLALAAATRGIGIQETQEIYANGIDLGITNADVFIVLQRFGRPVSVVNMSYTLAKTLAEKLNRLVAEWEKRTGQVLQTTDSIDEKFNKAGTEREEGAKP